MEVFYEKGRKYNCYKKGLPYFRITATIDGKRHTVYGNGEKDAKKKIEELKALSTKGFNIDLRGSKVGEVFTYWLYNVKRVDKNLKASSFARYDSTFKTHIKNYPIMNVSLDKLSTASMQRLLTEMYEKDGVPSASIAAALKVWKMFTKWAVEEGYMIKDPCKNVSVPGKYARKKRVITVFSHDEIKALMAYMERTNYQYDTLIKLALITGMRQGELLSLPWRNVHKGYIVVEQSTGVVTHVDSEGNRDRYREVWETKTENSVRQIPIVENTYKMLMDHKKAQAEFFKENEKPMPEYVFTTSEGKIVDSSSLTKSYKRLLTRAGIEDKAFHTLRHTFATEAIRSGVNVKDLQMLMGHSDIETTYIYVHADEESKRNAIEKMSKLYDLL